MSTALWLDYNAMKDELFLSPKADTLTLVRQTYIDGVTELVDSASVDDEGCLHSGADGVEPANWWTRFESIVDVQPLSSVTYLP